MNVSVIFTTYNQPRWLEKVIWGFEVQTHCRFEIVVADDGSDDETRQTIDRLRDQTGLAIHHVWQEDQGFRKCKILNQAIAASIHPYLVFTDGDCVPRTDFLAQHVQLAQPGRFLSGGMFPLPTGLSDQLTKEEIQSGQAHDRRWLRRCGLPRGKKLLQLNYGPRLGALLDLVTPTRPSFNGHNTSAWRTDIERANGFNENMTYGGLDRELGERLLNAGVLAKQIRHRAVVVHLNHSRKYVTEEGWKNNQAIRADTVGNKRVRTATGLDQYPRVQPIRLDEEMARPKPPSKAA